MIDLRKFNFVFTLKKILKNVVNLGFESIIHVFSSLEKKINTLEMYDVGRKIKTYTHRFLWKKWKGAWALDQRRCCETT